MKKAWSVFLNLIKFSFLEILRRAKNKKGDLKNSFNLLTKSFILYDPLSNVFNVFFMAFFAMCIWWKIQNSNLPEPEAFGEEIVISNRLNFYVFFYKNPHKIWMGKKFDRNVATSQPLRLFMNFFQKGFWVSVFSSHYSSSIRTHEYITCRINFFLWCLWAFVLAPKTWQRFSVFVQSWLRSRVKPHVTPIIAAL